ncbi:zinc finger CCCH domain-containing protein 34 [Ricinus communis]|uniref:Nucleic acid binding protein, putative n=1 Tax=Ricinus communis TaxID=3988 RepID=B9RT23_RICCO|nr:zinc finger CCCH domain-containing protein 34 [Ricinus communis]EEF45506.1 nucleic acid binding protein, putative [Ricinus communis]|eukprot:XP_002516892.1 zinc finger CCCH domain-containing protein 34 [Ricinus communis]
MDRYGRTQEGSQSDPSPEWTGPGPETVLEEGDWQLGLGEVEPGYPERPEEADCIYYLRTGFCGYGSRCRFNHPRDRGAVLGAARAGAAEFPERVGQPVCQYYMRTGTCKFGASCKYHHPKQGGGSANPVSLNYYGYPLRPGEKECTYYVKTGQCKFGVTCKFHHPQPANLQIQAQSPALQVAPVPAPVPASALYPNVQSPSVPSTQQYGLVVARPPLLPGSYVQGPYGPMLVSPGVVPYPSWSPYPGPISPVASPSTQLGVGSGVYGITQLSPSAPAYTGGYQAMPSSSNQKEQPSFPERPGQPECQYYMKTGDCKFGSSCKYHHPPELIAPKTNVVLSPMGLPLRPGAPHCTHYTQRGQCKFGPACKFDHPMGSLSYSPSASSLSDMPVAPYPVGSSMGTLAPSSSSSELRPELVSGSSKDSSSTRMSSSMSTTSGMVGSIFSKSGTVHHSGAQLSSQSSGLSTGSSSSSSTSIEAHTSS